MLRAIAHRGPDGSGIFAAPGIAMAAQRLAMLDIEDGQQPVANEAGDIVVTCNGELFAHRALRETLVSKGHVLRSRCDTELWPHLYEEYGLDLFAHARGQFAVALWDAKNRRLVLGRDRAGICPLHFAEHDGWLLWASEIKGLLASKLVRPALDPRAIDHVFSFFCAPARRTFFAGVTSLAPGELLDVKRGLQNVRRHSDIDFPNLGDEDRPTNIEGLVDSLEDALRRAVRQRLDADASVGAYLSGGVDSNLLLALARSEGGEAPPTFTIGFDGAGTDEASLAIAAAQREGSPLTVVRMTARAIADALPDLHLAAEAPVVDTSAACLMRLSAAASRAGVKAVLTGEGADEALAGYVWFRIEKALGILDSISNGNGSRAIRGVVFGLVGGAASGPRGALRALRTAQRDVCDPFGQVRHALYSSELSASLVDHDPYDDLDLDVERMKRWHPLNRSLYVEYRLMLPGLLLHAKGDRAAMRNGVEARYPFLDDAVIDLCARVAPELKIRRLTEKWLLRRVAARHLPSKAANRPKTMFRAKLSEVVLGPARPAWLRDLVSPASLKKSGLFDPEAVARELTRQRLLPTVTPRRLVMDGALTAVVATQLWHHLFLGGGLCDLPVWSSQ